MTTPKRVMIESPFHSDNPETHRAYKLYLMRAVYDCLQRKEAPFASHGFYTLFLNDKDQREREQGMACGFAWQQAAQLVAVYEDYGISKGMWEGISNAFKHDLKVEHRQIGKNIGD